MFIRKYWIPLSVLLVAIVGVGLYLLTTQPEKEPIVNIKPVEPLPKSTQQPKAEVSPIGDTAQDGHVHADSTFHAEPHEPSEVRISEPKAEPPPQPEHNKGAGNPPPFENLPVDLYDFEATKATMIENINFLKANWDPETFSDKELGREMRRAYKISSDIANATMNPTMLGFYTREQGRELRALHSGLGDFQNSRGLE